MKLERSFYTGGVLEVSEKLLGKVLVHRTKEGITKGRIVELEAYNGATDKAAHSYPNLCTERTKIQFGEGGYAYIYFIYGMYYCMNIVTGRSNEPESVLLRALEPVEGIELMKKRRGTDKLRNLCSGPGKLCQAMGITKAQYGMDLCGDTLYLEDAKPVAPESILRTKRINVDYAEEAKDFLWRYTIKDNPYVSVTQKAGIGGR
ncbi:MAG: DNA-3-methyladenine glycosylase [Lachnospiraceae bacterium]|nr:DNA-3-methyladenine glycosylase [Lachnospiraceae bacterium]